MTKTLYFDFTFMSRRDACYLFYKNYPDVGEGIGAAKKAPAQALHGTENGDCRSYSLYNVHETMYAIHCTM